MVSVKGDAKVPHATYKCELCDCYFNDDYAKKMHVKGRRHRLNYKKTYQPDLYIEPTKAQVREEGVHNHNGTLIRFERCVYGSPKIILSQKKFWGGKKCTLVM